MSYEVIVRDCPDCGAKPGELHDPGCDHEQCPCCREQAIGCDCSCDDSERLPWTGVAAGVRECVRLGLFCRDLYEDSGGVVLKYGFESPCRILWHQPCGPDDEGARPDLNEWYRRGCPE